MAAVVVASALLGCGSSNRAAGFAGDGAGDDGADASMPPTGDDASSPPDTGGAFHFDGGSILGDGGGSHFDAQGVFDVEPSTLQTITVTLGQTMPTVAYHATLDGQPVAAAWTVDRGDLGSVGAGPSEQGLFAPTGTTGGLVNVVAGFDGITLKRQVFVQLSGRQNGPNAGDPGEAQQLPTTVTQLGAGGGVGGVGGEGLGGPVTDPATLGALQNPAGNGQAQGLAMLYPYDQTVFPRGLLAPLLQWTWMTGDADAVQIHLETTSRSFAWTGTFGRPAILQQTGTPFVRHPVPQDVWRMATDTAGGVTPAGTPDQLTVSLVVAKGGQGYGPLRETWTIAPGRLEGTIYYNSYGTHLVQNSIEASYNGGPQFGAAVLGITEGATGPSVVAGNASPLGSGTGCRVCHVVSSRGSRLIVQHGDRGYVTTSTYDLKNNNAETVLTGYDGVFPWAALSPDGALALTNGLDLGLASTTAQLFPFTPTSTTPLTLTGLPAGVHAGTPAFSPDGKHVAFTFRSGTIGAVTGNDTQLVSLDFDPTANAFSNLRVLATMPNTYTGGFASFFPTDDGVVFQYQSKGPEMETWHDSQAQIWWSDLGTGTQAALYALNGQTAAGASSYVPSGPSHASDAQLNFEPTVNPVASGGYVWAIFTSRRLYGNVATADPYQSDPRNYDASLVANATCKKLWVAAIDLNAKPGTDPSHPAFYLPAQELLAGNSRGFWVLEPCRPDGATCQSGDQCCGGYCEPSGDGGLVCTNVPPNTTCSQPQERCTKDADCCDMTNVCINGFCSVVAH